MHQLEWHTHHLLVISLKKKNSPFSWPGQISYTHVSQAPSPFLNGTPIFAGYSAGLHYQLHFACHLDSNPYIQHTSVQDLLYWPGMRFISQEWETNQKEKTIHHASFKIVHFTFFFWTRTSLVFIESHKTFEKNISTSSDLSTLSLLYLLFALLCLVSFSA